MTMTRILGLACAATLAMSAPAFAGQPLFDGMAAMEKSRGFDLEKAQQCLLGAKVVQKAADYGLVDTSSAKLKRAITVAPKLEYMLRDRAQTQPIFDEKIAEVKAEYAAFQAADKKERKRLYKIARATNKTCGKPIQAAKVSNITRREETAALITNVDSDTARMCYAIAGKNAGSDIMSLLNSIMQTMTWSRVYIQAKHREGTPLTELVEALDAEAESERLKSADKSRVLAMYETCGEMYKKAEFEYKLTAPDAPKDGEEEVVESIVDWD